MSALCIGATVAALAAQQFTLSWTHSVEHTGWQETWVVEEDGLHLVRSAVQGSGAGMEPGPDARLQNGWWVWDSDVSVAELMLAASGATGGGWQFCAGAECREIGAVSGAPTRIAPCDEGSSAAASLVSE
ncbi:DUF1850 domain-containing protein [Sagittula stellata]|uniref:DUF1850 domain-containing protein n=1 Tax=Sagittula stellata (strain ATCC 700073 / DSM 11524 / E-37) TaxID=388399 RepID=A3K4Z4_SAGS3|nr:DUF1850 domain-containing protein [Sagittula stellata]EBA07595.1 hypothetical protein SSE37_13453 [Sagittula stellata E-37]